MAAAANGKPGRAAGGAKGGAIKDGKSASSGNAPVGSSKNASAKAAASAANVLDEPLVEYATSSKPDRELYNKEQEAIKAQLAIKQAQLVSVLQFPNCQPSSDEVLCSLPRPGQNQGSHRRLVRSRSRWRETKAAQSGAGRNQKQDCWLQRWTELRLHSDQGSPGICSQEDQGHEQCQIEDQLQVCRGNW